MLLNCIRYATPDIATSYAVPKSMYPSMSASLQIALSVPQGAGYFLASGGAGVAQRRRLRCVPIDVIENGSVLARRWVSLAVQDADRVGATKRRRPYRMLSLLPL